MADLTPGGPRSVPDGTALDELERVAGDVALAAGRLVVDDRPDDLRVASKSSGTDPVTVMDQRSQELLVRMLGELRPGDAVTGEEEGGTAGSSGLTWVVDPIDGTVNYLYGIPAYAVSVAAVVGDPTRPGGWEAVAGAVLNPETGELFHGHLGGGARLTTAAGTRALRVNDVTDLGLSLVGTGFGYAAEVRARQGAAVAELLPRVRDIRRAGSAALDLCAVACGRLDAYYETGLNAWDRAAGELLAREAGAVVGGPDAAGGPRQELTWASSPGVAEAFGTLVRDLTARHLVRSG